MRFQIYETTIMEATQEGVAAFDVVTSPAKPSTFDESVSYTALLSGADVIAGLSSATDVAAVLAALQDRSIDWGEVTERVRASAPVAAERTIELPLASLPVSVYERASGTQWEFAQYVAFAPLLPVEASPLEKRSLAELLVTGTATAVLAVWGASAFVVVTGPAVGLLAVRGLRAVGGAVWEGARPEFVYFGQDAATVLFTALRRRLGIPDTRPPVRQKQS